MSIWGSVESKCIWLACCGCREKSERSDTAPLPMRSSHGRSILGSSSIAFPELPADLDDEIFGSGASPEQQFQAIQESDVVVIVDESDCTETNMMPQNQPLSADLAVIDEVGSTPESSLGQQRQTQRYLGLLASVCTSHARIVGQIARAIEEQSQGQVEAQ